MNGGAYVGAAHLKKNMKNILEDFTDIKIGDSVPYFDTDGCIAFTTITGLKAVINGKANIFLHGINDRTGLRTYHPARISLELRKFAESMMGGLDIVLDLLDQVLTNQVKHDQLPVGLLIEIELTLKMFKDQIPTE